MPSGHARGPWDPGALHGGPVAALMVRALEQVPGSLPLSRVTVELLRPVPFRPLQLGVEALRPGKRVQLDRAELWAGAELVATALGGRIREEAVEVPPQRPEVLQPGPEDCEPSALRLGDGDAFHATGVELRFAARREPAAAEALVWVRLLRPLVDGETPTPWQRAAAAADFGNGVSSPLSHTTTTFINPDLTVMLFRAPRGEWIGMHSTTHLGALGRGLAESALYDETGRVGRSLQSLLVAPR